MTHSHDTTTPAMSPETVPSPNIAWIKEADAKRLEQSRKPLQLWVFARDPSDVSGSPYVALSAAPAPNPSPAAKGGDAEATTTEEGRYNVEAIAKVISLSYGENPEDYAPLSRICGPNNESLPCWMAYEEQAEAVWVWMQAVIEQLDAPALATPSPQPADAVREALEVSASKAERNRIVDYLRDFAKRVEPKSASANNFNAAADAIESGHAFPGGNPDPALASDPAPAGEAAEPDDLTAAYMAGVERGRDELRAERDEAVKALRKIEEEAKVANDVIRLNRDGQGQGRVRVVIAMHRIAEWTRAALATEASR